jgi:hypothetical protein
MEREKFYHEIDDWVAYNFVKIGAPLPSRSFIGSFIQLVEDELAGYAKSDREKLMPWEQVGGKEELDSLLPIMLTSYLNVRSLA